MKKIVLVLLPYYCLCKNYHSHLFAGIYATRENLFASFSNQML